MAQRYCDHRHAQEHDVELSNGACEVYTHTPTHTHTHTHTVVRRLRLEAYCNNFRNYVCTLWQFKDQSLTGSYFSEFGYYLTSSLPLDLVCRLDIVIRGAP